MFDKKQYDKDFQKDNYDRLSINVKKGEREVIAEYADISGYESLTDFVKYLIYTDMNNSQKYNVNFQVQITKNQKKKIVLM